MPVSTRISPVKLLFFAHALEGRGTERAVVRLLKEFDRSLVRPEIALVSSHGEFLDQIPSDVPLHDLRLAGRRTSMAMPQLDRLIRRLKPDCIVGVHISAARVVCSLRIVHPRLPVICMEADPFTRIEGDKGHLSLRLAVSRLTYQLASHIVAASDVVASDLEIHLRISSKKISLIPLPSLDDDVLRLAAEPVDQPPFDKQSDDPIIITIGNMYPHKDQGTLLQAFRIVNDSIPSHLVLIGEGDMRPELEKAARDLGISSRVWFTGFQTNPFKFLARAQAFASSSIAEGFDISQIEAMACGLPVIVTDAPRFRAVVHGSTGLIVPPRDPDSLATALISVLRTQDSTAILVRNAKVAAEEFHVSRIARRWEDLVISLAGRQVPSGQR